MPRSPCFCAAPDSARHTCGPPPSGVATPPSHGAQRDGYSWSTVPLRIVPRPVPQLSTIRPIDPPTAPRVPCATAPTKQELRPVTVLHGSSGDHHVHQRIDDEAHVTAAWAFAGFCGRDQVVDRLPLRIGQVTAIALVAHFPNVPTPIRFLNRL
jgi:hypothetical protein